jgi:RNA polymerase sigma-70 factor (ECF subfamily)
LSERTEDLPSVVASLVRAHGGKWLKFVARILRNAEDAEDVVQEAIERVLVRNRPFRSSEEVRMYLARAIANRAIELYHARRRERCRTLPLHDQNAAALEDDSSPQRYLEERERSAERARMVALVRKGLAHLPAKQYEALRLTLLEPRCSSMRDAGMLHGIPYSTLRHRSLQGIRRLQRFIRRALRFGPLPLLLA